MIKIAAVISLTALAAAVPAIAQETKKAEFPSPNEIVDKAAPKEWKAIAPSDLLIMDLEPDSSGKARRVIIQLMPPPFSQGWINNIRKLADAEWWDGTSVNRAQDNYVVQWGDPADTEENRKPLPDGLEVMTESDYEVIEGGVGFKPLLDSMIKIRVERAKIEQAFQIVKNNRLGTGRKLTPDEVEIKPGLIVGRPPKPPSFYVRRDPYSATQAYHKGWPIAIHYESIGERKDSKSIAPVHCYGALGVGRGLSPDTGSGAELYTVIGHAPRHLDRNIAVVGRIIEGIEHLSSLPRGTGPLGFYETAEERVPIESIRSATDWDPKDQARFEYLDTEGAIFAKYADARANRRDPFFIKPAGGADICNIPVPVRRMKGK